MVISAYGSRKARASAYHREKPYHNFLFLSDHIDNRSFNSRSAGRKMASLRLGTGLIERIKKDLGLK
jgi:hypothetical protein